MVRRRLRPRGHPLDRAGPAQRCGAARGHLLRRRLADGGRRRDVERGREGHARRVHAAREGVRRERAGPAPRRAVRGEARRPLGSAPQRHLPERGRRAEVAEIEKAGPSTFGFAVAAHPEEPDTAWFVPAVKDEKRVPVDGRLVVTRTRDGGATFDVLGKGLPDRDAYDLVYRHGLDVDASGRTLAFGSTTGSLFVSEDAGDSWTLCQRTCRPSTRALRPDAEAGGRPLRLTSGSGLAGLVGRGPRPGLRRRGTGASAAASARA